MTSPRVKICGITREEDARLAVELGADAIGFVFWESSPRAVGLARAKSIAREMPRGVTRVGVFVDTPPSAVTEIAQEVALDIAQLHGDEDVELYSGCGIPLLKALAVYDGPTLDRAMSLPPAVTVLVDAHAPIARGGTGRTADWAWAGRLATRRRIVLAGGLNAENIVGAVQAVGPWAVDVSSGVEDSPGIKNADKLRLLFEAVGPNAEGRARGLLL